ncbi:glycosyltransferase [Peribacillus frigoritolerans]|uniref:glycosyltransferase n=1 Tax=Peribacillus frigoritolerans TaxID=450367 RepID=UPI0021A79B36|nr:glycosyltransferase [Peribacillus frigoritolerans]MCT1391450.1 glycosyltransferase [Peribacillus frigoritolerans]
MKVVQIDASLFTFPYDKSLCEGLVKNKCKVILVGTKSERTGNFNNDTFKLWKHYYLLSSSFSPKSHLGKKIKMVIKGFEHLVNSVLLAVKLKEIKPDVIHFQWLPLPIIDKLLVGYLKKRYKVVFTMHDTKLYNGESSSFIQTFGYSSSIKKFDKIIVHTENGRTQLINSNLCNSENIEVIPHGIFTYYNDNNQEDVQIINDDKISILLFGAIKKYKGIDIFINAVSKMSKEYRDKLKITIAGNGLEEARKLKELAKKLKIYDLITWDIRFIPEEEVYNYFKKSSLVVMPYREIDQSGVLMTSLGFKVPVIASDIGGISETIVDGVHGRLIEPNSIEKLSETLVEIIENPTKIIEFKKNIDELLLGKLSWQAISNKTIKIYEKIN